MSGVETVRLQIRQPDGTHQTVTLEQHISVIGRDPSCDLILRDPKCSRRHAVLEIAPSGPLLRDSDSANGLFVNGTRVDRTLLRPGDQIRMGRSMLVLLADETEQAAVDAPAEAEQSDRRGLISGAAPHASPAPRPPALNALAGIWVLSGPLGLLAVGALVAHAGRINAAAVLLLVGAALATLLAWTLAVGLLARANWARLLHLVLCVPMALSCVFAPLAVVAATYLLGARTRRHFGARAPDPATSPRPDADRTERLFAAALVATTLLSLVLAASAFVAIGRVRDERAAPRRPAATEAVLARMHAMRHAQESFRRVCNVGYGDLDGLTNPASVVPGYRPEAGPFLPPEQVGGEAHGYRFRLAVGGLMTPSSDCSTLRRFRLFEYTATPIDGKGTHFLLAPDGAIRVATDRPAHKDDPVVAP